jgi:hypothetical protein
LYDHAETLGSRAFWYGDVIVVFKPSIMNQATVGPTVLFGDSILATASGNKPSLAPCGVARPFAICYDHMTQAPVKHLGGIEQFCYSRPPLEPYPDFVEVQFHEPLGIEDIDYVVMLESTIPGDAKPADLKNRVTMALDDAQIPWQSMERRLR